MSNLIKCDSCDKIVPFPEKYIHLQILTKCTSMIIVTDNDINRDIDLCICCFNELRINSKFLK